MLLDSDRGTVATQKKTAADIASQAINVSQAAVCDAPQQVNRRDFGTSALVATDINCLSGYKRRKTPIRKEQAESKSWNSLGLHLRFSAFICGGFFVFGLDP